MKNKEAIIAKIYEIDSDLMRIETITDDTINGFAVNKQMFRVDRGLMELLKMVQEA